MLRLLDLAQAGLLGVALVASLGALLGVATGLVPGIHVNLFAALMLEALPFLTATGLLVPASALLLAMGMAQTMVDIVPTLVLGAVDEDSSVSVLPGMDLVKRGFAMEAVRLWLRGCLAGLLLSLALMPLLLRVFPLLYGAVKPWTGWLLVMLLARMAFSSSWRRALANSAVIGLSGMLGVVAFTHPSLSEPVFPLMSGLFGCSGLVLALMPSADQPQNETMPQRRSQHLLPVLSLPAKTWGRAGCAATLGAALQVLLPGVGRSQSGALCLEGLDALAAAGRGGNGGRAQRSKGALSSSEGLLCLGMLSTMGGAASLAALLSFGKARDGAVVALSQMVKLDGSSLWLFLAVLLISAGLAAALTIALARLCLPLLERRAGRGTRVLSLCSLMLVVGLVAWLSGAAGMLVLAAGTSLGVLCDSLHVRRRLLLASLMIPVAAYWLL